MTEVYSEEDGVKYDAHIHGPMLDNATADKKHRRRARLRAKNVHKLTDEQIRKLYGDVE